MSSKQYAPYERACPKCGHRMLDGDLGIDEVAGWYVGDARIRDLKSRRQRNVSKQDKVTIVAFRCENCGAVELWTPKAPT